MEVREAVVLAKRHIGEVFADEAIVNIGLEETDFDHTDNAWLITVGFDRKVCDPFSKLSAVFPQYLRSYKVVRILDDTGEVLSVKHREIMA